MDDKINGSVYHKFINNYQKPILISKKDSKNYLKAPNSKKSAKEVINSKLIYVNKKNLIIPSNQNDISSDIKSITNNSERTLTPLQTQYKLEKNGNKQLLKDVNRINTICNGLSLNPKFQRKGNQSLNNETNKLNSKSIERDDNNNININNYNLTKNEKIKNIKNDDFISSTIQRLKKIQTINNLNTNGNSEINNSNNKLISSYASNNKNEPKRKKNYSLNYNTENKKPSNANKIKDKDKDKKDIIDSDYLLSSNKIDERKKNFIRENFNEKELSRLIQENYNFNFHRRFNNYVDFNKNNLSTNNQNITATSKINNSIDCNCIFTENYKRENPNLKKEFFKTTKTCDDEDKNDIIKKNNNIRNNKNKNAIINNNAQKKRNKRIT